MSKMVKCMKKILKILCLCLTCVICAVGFSACSDNTKQETSGMEKHEIELNLDNYLLYFDVKNSQPSKYSPSSPYQFSGCLAYAFYDNVCVSFEYHSNGESTTHVLKLNANGNGAAPITGSTTTVNLVDISGKVVFWM